MMLGYVISLILSASALILIALIPKRFPVLAALAMLMLTTSDILATSEFVVNLALVPRDSTRIIPRIMDVLSQSAILILTSLLVFGIVLRSRFYWAVLPGRALSLFLCAVVLVGVFLSIYVAQSGWVFVGSCLVLVAIASSFVLALQAMGILILESSSTAFQPHSKSAKVLLESASATALNSPQVLISLNASSPTLVLDCSVKGSTMDSLAIASFAFTTSLNSLRESTISRHSTLLALPYPQASRSPLSLSINSIEPKSLTSSKSISLHSPVPLSISLNTSQQSISLNSPTIASSLTSSTVTSLKSPIAASIVYRPSDPKPSKHKGSTQSTKVSFQCSPRSIERRALLLLLVSLVSHIMLISACILFSTQDTASAGLLIRIASIGILTTIYAFEWVVQGTSFAGAGGNDMFKSGKGGRRRRNDWNMRAPLWNDAAALSRGSNVTLQSRADFFDFTRSSEL